jgi:AmmeMemoRadiSam system protein B/AmmeMemoRadiSam system protein A
MTDSTIRLPAVAGLFYPGDQHTLQTIVDDLLQQSPRFTLQPKAMIVPHAGYMYSGSTAARAYSSLDKFADTIKKVVMLGPAHMVYFKGIALDSANYFATPLGDIPIDESLRRQALKLPFVQSLSQAHSKEHCLEVQLPFCQRVLGDFTLLPFVVGDCSKEQVMQLLDVVWGGPETLIVISSDLSHYLPYAVAQQKDSETCLFIDSLEEEAIGHDSACGYYPLRGFLAYARQRGMVANRLALCNSGDTAGDKSRVVGYAAYHFYEQLRVSDYCGEELLALANQTIEAQAMEGRAFEYEPSRYSDVLNLLIPSFITLSKQGQLRGCMGSLKAQDNLGRNVIHNAHQAAFADPRFEPVQGHEIEELSISISLLTPLVPVQFSSYEQLLEQVRPGIDGLLLQYQHYHATFLPSVWETLPRKEEFIHHLLVKMGLAKNFWSPQMQAWTYQTEYIQAANTIA